MAYKDSGAIAKGSVYTLGEYSFRLNINSTQEGGEKQVQAQMTKDGESAYKSIYLDGDVEIQGWRVEANGDTADVYVKVTNRLDPGAIQLPIPSASTGYSERENGDYHESFFSAGEGLLTYYLPAENNYIMIGASKSAGSVIRQTSKGVYKDFELTSTYTHGIKTVYYTTVPGASRSPVIVQDPCCNGMQVVTGNVNSQAIAWIMIYGDREKDNNDKLVARFAIDLHDADGTGADSDWNDPGDWDQDQDPDDPYDPANPRTTLRLNITGASAGTHSGAPSAPQKQTIYGSGGVGGNGGGGGAGAATVIVYKFATDRADSKEITATARGPGTGSSGGPGGTGGDGCILIFY